MKLIKQEINQQEITDYCGIIYEGEPLIFINDNVVLNIRKSSLMDIEDIDASKITEEVFFENGAALYRWAVDKLVNKKYV